jgi:molecular chaperone GrpE (heat shock protein)
MSHATEIGPDFAAVMQELSAQAAVAPPRDEEPLALVKPEPAMRALLNAMETLSQRIGGLENAVSKKFEALENTRGSASADFAQQFQKLEEQLAAILTSETFNQKLFDSLHQELISYRDNFVRDSLQKPFIRDLLVLYDDLSGVAGQLEKAAESEGNPSACAQARDNLSNTLHFLIEILHRLEVNEMEPTETVDLKLHRVISYEPAEFLEDDGRIVLRIKRGFIWRDRVLRPEEVIAKRFQ